MGLTGSGIYFYYIVKNLLTHGDSVYYITSTSTKHIKSLQKNKKFRLIHIPMGNRIRFFQLGKLLFGLKTRGIICELIEKEDIELIHINESFNPYFFIIKRLISKSGKNVRVIITAHGCTNFESKLIRTFLPLRSNSCRCTTFPFRLI